MNICFVLPPIERYSPTSGGAIATCVMQVAQGLLLRGHDVTVLADNHGDDAYDVGRLIPVRYPDRDAVSTARRAVSKLRCQLGNYDWPRYDIYLDSVRNALRELPIAPDAIVCENDLVLPRLLRADWPDTWQVLWLHNEQGTKHPAPRELFDAVDRVVTNSHYIRRYTQEKYRVGEERFTVVHNGVDLDQFYPREDYSTPREPVRVLYLGRLDPNKGVDLAVDAVKELRHESLPVEMTVAGGQWFFGEAHDDANPYLRELRNKMKAADATHLGHVPRGEVPAVVRDHDVVCVLSRSQEPFGLVVLEAMASGCAVVASDRGGLPEACGDAGIAVDVSELQPTIDALRTLVTDPAALADAKVRSVRRASITGWDLAAASFDRIFANLASRSTRAVPPSRMGAMA